jgi:hypothetical protein
VRQHPRDRNGAADLPPPTSYAGYATGVCDMAYTFCGVCFGGLHCRPSGGLGALPGRLCRRQGRALGLPPIQSRQLLGLGLADLPSCQRKVAVNELSQLSAEAILTRSSYAVAKDPSTFITSESWSNELA